MNFMVCIFYHNKNRLYSGLIIVFLIPYTMYSLNTELALHKH